jgi:hypothetical protein
MVRKFVKNKYHPKHVKRLHGFRVFWFLVLAIGLIGIHFSDRPIAATAKGQVLSYATGVSVNSLASETNAARSANGLGALALNSQLNSGAQAKANHMIANNYWSHTAPDGTEPWYFFTQAGYSYIKAGENLAYGFDASDEIVDAWMSSPGHRANILGGYKDMGFGFANGPNYQGGEYTVVVAFYGSKQSSSPPAPAPTPAPSKSVKSTPTPAPTPKPIPTSAPASKPEAKQESKSEPVNTEPAAQPVQEKQVTTLQNILNGNAGWPMYASLAFVGTSTIGFAATHVQLVRRSWKVSKHFVLVHPALDTAVLIALIFTLFTATVGVIR